ncbi:MAG: ATP-binding protein [Candidatus Marinimicrobia bacterium]|nr:ATP-binding protein [Candidatus Neomarinimicrobiota bacterium]MDD5540745.1 ATP-binding protein [Candidatus Neomarinimicrobiota bacterium]
MPISDEESGKYYHEQIKRDGYAPLPNCPVCHGAGFVHPIFDGKVAFNKIVSCSYPGCIVESRRAYQSGESFLKQIGVARPEQQFVNFEQYEGNNESYAAFYNLAFIPGSPRMILCTGGAGNGKTHLCNALAIELNRTMIVRLFVFAELINKLKVAMGENRLETDIEFIKTVQALIIDDVLEETLTPWAASKLDEIIDARYRNERITVLTSNIDMSKLPDRTYSRFSDKRLAVRVINMAPDRRPML